MTPEIDIKRTPDGRVLARRRDGKPLTPEDHQAARAMAAAEDTPIEEPESALYTLQELLQLRGKSEDMLRTVHRIKIIFGGGSVLQ